MNQVPESDSRTQTTPIVGGDEFSVGDISAPGAVAIGRDARATVNKFAGGDLIEHQNVIKIYMSFGADVADSQEAVVSAVMSQADLDRASISDLIAREVDERVARQFKELVSAEQQLAAKGVQTTFKSATDLGMMALSYGDLATAMSYIDKAQKAAEAVYPQDARSWALRGYCAKTKAQIAAQQEDQQQRTRYLNLAEFSFTESLRLQPDNPSAHNGMGNFYASRRKYVQAIRSYKQAIALAPHYTAAFHDLAISYEALMRDDEEHAGEWCAKAILAWEQAYDLAPHDPSFSEEYRGTMLRRIRYLKLQCE